MADTAHTLPNDQLLQIQSTIVNHFQSLNASGQVSSGKVTREDALRALGFTSPADDAEQWLCGADNNCGVKT